MNRKTEVTIFFTALVMMGVAFVGGISYFKTPTQSQGLLADIGEAVPSQTPSVETIPTSTIITTSSSAFPLPPVATATPLALPYALTASTATSTYWPKAWGDVSFTNNSLALIPDPVHRGANSFLEGDASWTDYAVSADTSWLMGGWFDIVARVSNDEKNFVYCEFGPNGTEVIERVNTVDTQLAATSASTTNAEVERENFGMQVYGNDVACTMDGQEVVGAQVGDDNESPAGGIGFVIFGAPPQQKQVMVSHISVASLPSDPIVVPFPLPVAPKPVAVAPKPAATTPPPTPTSTPPPPPAPAPIIVATTTKFLPYHTSVFLKSQGWNTYWGNFLLAPSALTIGASTDGTGGGVLLDGTSAWSNYTFTATLDWLKGESFGLYARYIDAQNYVLCYFDETDVGDVQIKVEEHVNGVEYTLAQGDVENWDQSGGSDITASIEVQDSVGICSFDNHSVSSAGLGNTLALPYAGRIGFMTWDPTVNNSRIIVTSVTAASNY